MNDEKYIDELLRKFFDVDITTEEMDYLYSYFLSLTTIPPKWKDDAPIIRAFAIMRYCKTTEAEFRQSLKAARQTAETRKRLVPKSVLRIAAAAACVAAIAIGFWKISTDAVPTMPTTEVLQPTLVVQAEAIPTRSTHHCQDHKPTTITNNNTENTVQTIINHTHTATPSQSSGTVDTAVDDTTTMNTDTILQLQTDWQKYETNYLAYADISSDNMTSYCSSKCTAEYINQAVCEIINCI